MTEYRATLRLLFNSFYKTYELASRIAEGEARRSCLKRVEASYRRFQKEVEVGYDPQEEVGLGLMQHYHHLTEQHYRAMLLRGAELSEQSHRRLNPYPRRERQFEVNRENRGRIDFSGFIGRGV